MGVGGGAGGGMTIVKGSRFGWLSPMGSSLQSTDIGPLEVTSYLYCGYCCFLMYWSTLSHRACTSTYSSRVTNPKSNSLQCTTADKYWSTDLLRGSKYFLLKLFFGHYRWTVPLCYHTQILSFTNFIVEFSHRILYSLSTDCKFSFFQISFSFQFLLLPYPVWHYT